MTRTYYEEEKNKMVDTDKLKGTVPDEVLDNFDSLITLFEINSNLKVFHFLSQVMHESMDFKVSVENLNYSEKGLKAVFGKYFPGDLAKEYARKPEKIASRVYANRMGNGDEASGEGWKYRGRGYMQLTGKNNYTSFSEFVENPSIIILPERLTEPRYALLSAGWFWKINGCNQLASSGASEDVVKQVTKRINGGYNGLEDRYDRFTKLCSLFS